MHKWEIIENPPIWKPNIVSDPKINYKITKRKSSKTIKLYEGEKLYFEYEQKAYSVPFEVRKRVNDRDKGICASCGCNNSITEMDHKITRKEWIEIGFEEKIQIDDFTNKIHNINNIQTLCTQCHSIKTKLDKKRLSDKGYLKHGQVRKL